MGKADSLEKRREEAIMKKLGITNLPTTHYLKYSSYWVGQPSGSISRYSDGKVRGILELEANGNSFEVYVVETRKRNIEGQEARYFLEVCEEKQKDSIDGIPPWQEISISDPRIKNYTVFK